jgi:F-type H+-transporting ATPase subunit b
MSITESLGIDWRVIIAQGIGLIVLFLFLRQYLFGPVSQILRQRKEQIANSLAGADAQHVEAESLRKEYQARLDGIADEARMRLDQAVKDAEVARQRLLEQAQTDIRALHERSQAQLALDREQLRRDLRTEMADIAVMAAGKALREQMTPGLQSAVVDQVIRELEQPVAH